MRPHAHETDEQTRLTAYGHIIHRYLRYVLIRCTGYTNDKSQVQRMAVYALVTACLLFDKLTRLGQLGTLVEMMVKIVGEDPTPDLSSIATSDRANGAEPVFVLDARMCEVAGAINALDQFSRELLILHHIEGLEVATLADVYSVSVAETRAALAGGGERTHRASSRLVVLGPSGHAGRARAAGIAGGLYGPSLGQRPRHLHAGLRGSVERVGVVSC